MTPAPSPASSPAPPGPDPRPAASSTALADPELLPSPASPPAQPEAVAVGFVAALRSAGLEVSLLSSMLYAEALCAVDVGRPDDVYWAGRAALVHRPEDFGLYDAVFWAYWTGAPGLVVRSTPTAVPVTVELDDPDGDDDDDGADRSDGERVAVRYSPAEILAGKDFADYSDDELAEARRLMERMCRQGPTRPSRRHRPVRTDRGRPDVRRTVRAALRSGGEPVRLCRRAPATRPRKLVLLLDVSGSMEPYARALLRFVQAAVAGRGRVEAFALGTRLTRLTRELSSRDPDRALRDAAEAVLDWSGGTRLGAGLGRFNDEWGCRGMARGAVAVILSDGWDRGEPAEMAEQMRRLSRVAHRVVWVNPLKATPGYQPLARGMAAALPHVDAFVEGHNLDSLERLAALILEDRSHRGGQDRPSRSRRSLPLGDGAGSESR